MADSRRSVLITGASSGIGSVTAHLLLDQGWNVFAAARRQGAMDDLQRRGAVSYTHLTLPTILLV